MSKVHVAVDTLGHLLAVAVTLASEQERAQVADLSEQVQTITGDNVELAYVDQGYTGQELAAAAAEQGIQLGANFSGTLAGSSAASSAGQLSDGTTLVALRPGWTPRRRRGDHVVARLMRYTLYNPQRTGHWVEHRLVAFLLDPATALTWNLILAYHRRWEIELVVDERDDPLASRESLSQPAPRRPSARDLWPPLGEGTAGRDTLPRYRPDSGKPRHWRVLLLLTGRLLVTCGS